MESRGREHGRTARARGYDTVVSEPTLAIPSEGPAESVERVERVADGRRRRLDPRYVTAARLVNGITALGMALAGSLGFLVLSVNVAWPRSAIVGTGCALAVLLLGAAAVGFVWPPLELARTSWRVDADGIEIRRGVVWRNVILVPRARVQHTDVSQGPIQRRFGLATLVIHTAGTHEYEVTLEGLAPATALAVRDALLGEGSDDGA